MTTIVEEIREIVYKMSEDEQRKLLALITNGKFSVGIPQETLSDRPHQINADTVTLDTIDASSIDGNIEATND